MFSFFYFFKLWIIDSFENLWKVVDFLCVMGLLHIT